MIVQEELNTTSNPIIRPNYDPMKVHGVWDRSSYDKDEFLDNLSENLTKKPFIRGFRISPKWADLEKQQGEYKWKIIDQAVEKIADQGKYFYFQLLVGPDSPRWIYEQGVPKVKIEAKKEGKEDKEDLKWPYYPDPKYKEYLTTTIAAIADHMFEEWSDEMLERLVFIQVATGSTGDEAPYKGTAKEEIYELNDEHPEWNKYRRKIFRAYARQFQQPKRRKSIPLLFNKIDEQDYPYEHNWVNDNVEYLGRKGSVLPRGYHLTEMGEFIKKFRPYTVDPQDRFIFTRAEMDQTWRHTYFKLNQAMNMYWAMLNALHGGLCVWDLSNDLLYPSDDTNHKDYLESALIKDFKETFEFFNKYAGDLFPESAKGAFIAFHKGLDSSDTEAYPVEEFGGANDDLNKKNTERYKKICQKYSQFNARMNDAPGAALGQLQQRKKDGSLAGFNDSGWQIPRGNYERFITQINPDENNVAWWRVGWPKKKSEENSESKYKTLNKYSRFARGLRSQNDHIDLRVNKKFYSVKEGEKPTKIEVRLIYYFREGGGSFTLKYDSTEKPYQDASNLKEAFTVTEEKSGEWLTKKVTIDDATFNNDGNIPDISLVNNDDQDVVFHLVETEKLN